jgi:aryl-alcohol dehydrogenase-like predicted oxidoreductase
MDSETLLNALADEVEKGRINAIGVSNYSAEQMRQAHTILGKRGIPLAVNQVQYSLLYRTIEEQGVLAAAQELGITILAYSPLAQGLLTGKYTQANRPPGPRRLKSGFKPEGMQKIAPILDLLRQLGGKYQKTPAQVALNWLIGQDNVIPIPGAKTAQQARENAGALGWSLSQEDWQLLEDMTR